MEGVVWLVWSLNSYPPPYNLPVLMAEELTSPPRLSDPPRVRYAKAQWRRLEGIGYKQWILKCIATGRVFLTPQPGVAFYPHAELRVLDFVLSQRLVAFDPNDQILIGISKKPCILCSRAIACVQSVLVRSPHLVIYNRWCIPSFLLLCFSQAAKPELAILKYLQASVGHYSLRFEQDTNCIAKGKKLRSFEDQDQFNDSDDENSYLWRSFTSRGRRSRARSVRRRSRGIAAGRAQPL